MDNLTREQRSRNMKRIRSKNTEIERMLRRELWHRGYRYRKNYGMLPGKPDIALTKYKIAVFCDSEFFHGKDWESQAVRILKCNNSEYWLKKIQRNIDRDYEVNKQLEALGWKVLRFWGRDIKKNVEDCVSEIEEAIYEDAEYLFSADDMWQDE